MTTTSKNTFHLIRELEQAGKISPPKFVSNNLCLLSIGGSYAYGVSTDLSDTDLIGVVIPPKEYVYPQKILGYDHVEKFDDYQQHHINYNGTEYDVKLYSLPRLFLLAEQGNPNILDFILGPEHCNVYCDEFGKAIRDIGQEFLSKSSVPRYIGFAFDHLKSMEGRRKSGIYPEKRKHLFEKYGYDTKDAGHIIRCLMSLQDILTTQTYNVAKHADFVKRVRNGEFSFEEIVRWTKSKEIELYALATISELREKPDHELIRDKLIRILEKKWYEGIIDIPV